MGSMEATRLRSAKPAVDSAYPRTRLGGSSARRSASWPRAGSSRPCALRPETGSAGRVLIGVAERRVVIGRWRCGHLVGGVALSAALGTRLLRAVLGWLRVLAARVRMLLHGERRTRARLPLIRLPSRQRDRRCPSGPGRVTH